MSTANRIPINQTKNEEQQIKREQQINKQNIKKENEQKNKEDREKLIDQVVSLINDKYYDNFQNHVKENGNKSFDVRTISNSKFDKEFLSDNGFNNFDDIMFLLFINKNKITYNIKDGNLKDCVVTIEKINVPIYRQQNEYQAVFSLFFDIMNPLFWLGVTGPEKIGDEDKIKISIKLKSRSIFGWF